MIYRGNEKEYMKKYNKEYHQKNREKLNAYSRKHYQENKDYYKKWNQEHREYYQEFNKKLKNKILTHYGNGKPACVKCGFDNMKALSIDHIDGDGSKHRRKENNKGGTAFYFYLKRNNFPQGYQTLCMNCQFIKSYENKEYSKGRLK